MLRHARNYFMQWPEMEWVYFGRVLIRRPSSPHISRPRFVGPRDDITEAAMEAYLDWVFGWKSFVPRGLEEWAGVGVDYEGLMMAERQDNNDQI
jgi:hypothetical protein